MRLTVAALAVCLALPTFAEDAPDPNEVYVKNLTYNGTGCPLNSVAEAMAPDGLSFTLLFDQFVASAGPGIGVTENRKNCAINVELNVPQGWSYTIATIDFRGFAQLEKKVEATQKATYYFAGELEDASAAAKLKGPFEDDYVNRDTLAIQNLVWSPCGEDRNLNINAQVRVSNAANKKASGFMTVDSVDGTVQMIYHLRWQRCPN